MSKSALLQRIVVLFRKRYGRAPTTDELDEMADTADCISQQPSTGMIEGVEIVEFGHIMVLCADDHVLSFAE